jgi:uncharacterized protein (DUF934 family)
MPRLIKGGAVVDDDWSVLRDVADLAALPAGPVIVPLALWRIEREALLERGKIGVWLGPTDDPDLLAGDVARLDVIAIDFPQFSDGRGYSSARLLRQKYGYAGELRAIGDVLRDQLDYMRACGFDTFAVRTDRDPEQALSGFADFSDHYQATVTQPLPLFRRRAAALAGRKQ